MRRFVSGVSFLAVLCFFATASLADSINYFYDSAGRLIRAIKTTGGVVYSYDAVGNLISAVRETSSSSTPEITSVSPSTLLVGHETKVTITGRGLLLAEDIASTQGRFQVKDFFSSDTRITATIKGLVEGADSISVSSRGVADPALVDLSFVSGVLSFSPGQLSLRPGQSSAMTVSLSPAPGSPLSVNLKSSDLSVASVPEEVTISPSTGQTTFAVLGKQPGAANIDVAGGDFSRAVVFVGQQEGAVNVAPSRGVSVAITPPPSTSMAISTPVSIAISSPLGSSGSSSQPVSVNIASSPGAAFKTASPVSVGLAAVPGPFFRVAPAVSVSINTPPGVKISGSSPVSIRITDAPGSTIESSPPVSFSVLPAP